MNARELAEWIRNDARYQAGMTVYLFCCETGKGDRSFAQKLANTLGAFGAGLREGDIVLPGSPHAMVAVAPGDVFRAEFAHLGPVTVRFSRDKSEEAA